MATSGSIDFSMTTRDVCTYALEELRVIAAGETPTDDDMQAVRKRLTLMLKSWQITGPNLWRQTDGSVALVASTASYTLSPRPHRVIEARYRDANSRDLPMVELTRQEYVDLPLKTTTGIPTSYYVNYQRAATTLYVWPVPASVTTETIVYTYQRVFEDADTLENDLDIPQEYLETVGMALAARCLGMFGKKDQDLERRSLMLIAEADQSDREPFVRFVPDRNGR